MKRAQPLVDVEAQQKEAEAEFDKQWEAGELGDWEEARQPSGSTASGEGIWCAACESVNV